MFCSLSSFSTTVACWGLLFSKATASAMPVFESRQDVGIQSVNLKFGSTCPDNRQTDIQNAWNDAMNLATNVGKVDFNDVAAIEFFGPPALNSKYQKSIQAVFDAVKTFGQGWRITPTPFKVNINIGCGPAGIETKDRCIRKGSGLKAFTWNTKASDGTGPDNYHDATATTNMYFCNSFWGYLKPLADKIKDNKDKDYTEKFNMDYYKNRASVVLHELMHSDRAAYVANEKRHIQDMSMNIYEYRHQDGKNYERVLVSVDAYGAKYTKILARTQRKSIATDITINADSFSQYVLSKYVQKAIGGYPWLPIAEAQAIGDVHPRIGLAVFTDGTDWGLNGDTNAASLKAGGDDISFVYSADADPSIASALSDENPVPALTDLEWTSDDKYPADYIKQLNEWADKAGRTTVSNPLPAPTASPVVPAGPVVSQHCFGLGSKKYVSQPQLDANIKDYCSQAVKQGTQDPGSGSIVRRFNMGAPNEVDISVDFPSGNKIPFDESECNKWLMVVSAGCDGNDPNNPANWKGGGTISVDQAIYHITPMALRQPLPNTPGGSCDVRYKFIYDEFWIWGNGYADSDFGQTKGGLLQQIKGCNGLTDWSFNYGLGSDGREWSAHGHLLIGKAGCVARAIKSAGGPQGVHCSGNS